MEKDGFCLKRIFILICELEFILCVIGMAKKNHVPMYEIQGNFEPNWDNAVKGSWEFGILPTFELSLAYKFKIKQ